MNSTLQVYGMNLSVNRVDEKIIKNKNDNANKVAK
jgi:hypothetical protein